MPKQGLPKKPDRLRRILFQRSGLDKLAATVAVEEDYNWQTPQMYRKHHNGQLSTEDFHVPFGGTWDPDNRWVLFSSLMPWGELEETNAPQFSRSTGAPAKAVRLAFGALFSLKSAPAG